MPRPSVPHCKDCPYVHETPQYVFTGLGYFVSSRSSWTCLKLGLRINGQEIRTSPKWCPGRRDANTMLPGVNI